METWPPPVKPHPLVETCPKTHGLHELILDAGPAGRHDYRKGWVFCRRCGASGCVIVERLEDPWALEMRQRHMEYVRRMTAQFLVEQRQTPAVVEHTPPSSIGGLIDRYWKKLLDIFR